MTDDKDETETVLFDWLSIFCDCDDPGGPLCRAVKVTLGVEPSRAPPYVASIDKDADGVITGVSVIHSGTGYSVEPPSDVDPTYRAEGPFTDIVPPDWREHIGEATIGPQTAADPPESETDRIWNAIKRAAGG